MHNLDFWFLGVEGLKYLRMGTLKCPFLKPKGRRAESDPNPPDPKVLQTPYLPRLHTNLSREKAKSSSGIYTQQVDRKLSLPEPMVHTRPSSENATRTTDTHPAILPDDGLPVS